MDKQTYKQTLESFSSQINDLINKLKEARKEYKAAKERDWVTTMDFALRRLEQADEELWIGIDEVEVVNDE